MNKIKNLFKKEQEINEFFNQPYLKYKNFFEDFTIHKTYIDRITEKDLMSIPEPESIDLIAIFPLSEILYYHIVTAITTCKTLNQMLLSLVPQQMNEMMFWYRYFHYLLTNESEFSLLKTLKNERLNMKLSLISHQTRELYINYIINHYLGSHELLLMKYIQIVNTIDENVLDRTFFKYSERISGKPKNLSEAKYRYEFIMTIINHMFKRCSFIYSPYMSALLMECVQIYEIGEAFYKVIEFLIKSQCDGHMYTSEYGLENFTDYIFFVLTITMKDNEKIKRQVNGDELAEKIKIQFKEHKQEMIPFIKALLKNLTIRMYERIPVIDKKPIIELILQDGKSALLKIFCLFFQSMIGNYSTKKVNDEIDLLKELKQQEENEEKRQSIQIQINEMNETNQSLQTPRIQKTIVNEKSNESTNGTTQTSINKSNTAIIDFDNLKNSITKVLEEYRSRIEPNKYVTEIIHYRLDSLLIPNHIFNTLDLPDRDFFLKRIVPKEQLENFSEIISAETFIELYLMLPNRFQMLKPELVFLSSLDGLSLKTLYSRCEYHSFLLILARRGNYIFGAFVAESFQMRNNFYGNSETFLFSIKPHLKKYPHIEGSNTFIINSTQDHLSFGGGSGDPSLRFDGYLNVKSSRSPTFNNSPLVPESLAPRCDKVEVFAFC